MADDDWASEEKKAKAEQKAILEAVEMATAMNKYGWDHECGMVYARLRRFEPALSCLVLPLSCLVLSRLVLCYLVLCCVVLSCLVLFWTYLGL